MSTWTRGSAVHWQEGGVRGRLHALEDTGHFLEAGENLCGDSVREQQREMGQGWVVQSLLNHDI